MLKKIIKIAIKYNSDLPINYYHNYNKIITQHQSVQKELYKTKCDTKLIKHLIKNKKIENIEMYILQTNENCVCKLNYFKMGNIQ